MIATAIVCGPTMCGIGAISTGVAFHSAPWAIQRLLGDRTRAVLYLGHTHLRRGDRKTSVASNSASPPGFLCFQALGTACCLRDLAWHPNQHVLALAGYGADSPILLYYSEATAGNQTEVM